MSFFYVHLNREKLLKQFLYEKCVQKMLMKLTPGVNFINVLRAAFLKSDPKSAKKTENMTVFWGLSGSARSKAAR